MQHAYMSAEGVVGAASGACSPLQAPTRILPLPVRPPPPPPLAGTVEQVQEVTSGLQRLDHYLMNVTNEQRYLYARTVRHLRTAESTHGRTLGYMLLICGTIVAASFVQVGGRTRGGWARGAHCSRGATGGKRGCRRVACRRACCAPAC